MRFQVLIGDMVVGTSDLEYGDPPMGVAHGSLLPNSAYREFQHLTDEDGFVRTQSEIRIRSVDGQQFLEPSEGAFIQDFSTDMTKPEVEVSILGLHRYEDWFPEHYKKYEQQFSN